MTSSDKENCPTALFNFDSSIFQEVQRNADIHNLDEGAIFQFPNRVQTSFYFVRQGVLRSYVKYNEKDVTRWFYGKNDLVLSLGSFLYDLPSGSYLQALTSSLLIEISKDYYHSLCSRHPEFKELVDRLNGNYLMQSQLYTDRLKTFSALERYRCFVEEYPDVNLRMQVQHVASFLGITPDTLTKVRKQYQQKQHS